MFFYFVIIIQCHQIGIDDNFINITYLFVNIFNTLWRNVALIPLVIFILLIFILRQLFELISWILIILAHYVINHLFDHLFVTVFHLQYFHNPVVPLGIILQPHSDHEVVHDQHHEQVHEDFFNFVDDELDVIFLGLPQVDCYKVIFRHA